MTMDLKAIAEVLNRDDVRSRVLKDGAFFDAFMGVTIGMYFTTRDRFREFHELIIDRLSFDERLRVLERLPLKKSYKSAAALPVIRKVQQARNFIAHEYHVFHEHPKLAKAGWLDLFVDYPNSYVKSVQLAHQRLLRLTGTKEFLELLDKITYDAQSGSRGVQPARKPLAGVPPHKKQ